MKAISSIAVLAVSVWCAVAVAGAGAGGASSSSVAYNRGVVNTKVLRSINLQTHVEENVIQFDVQNGGSAATDYYLVAIPADKAERLSLLTARQLPASKGGRDGDDDDDEPEDRAKDGVLLTATRVTAVTGLPEAAPAGTVFYRVALRTPLAGKATVSLAVSQVFTRTLKPYPAEIAQADTQLVLFTDSVYPFSAYPTDGDSTTSVKLATNKIQSHTKKNVEVKDDVLRYGPYTDVAAFAVSPLSVHFENEYPFVTMSSARKLIEVSHFGNINVEEHYILQHTGAKLKGVFSRYDYQRQQKPGPSFRAISAVLPASATNIYYRDQIGNISTSAVQHLHTHTQMDVQPRFPMFGGWQTDFYIGYDVPAHEFLSVDANDGSRYVLNMSLVASPFLQAAIDDFEVQVILPEFATDIQWVSPFEVDSEARASHVTYLDTVGRPVLILKKTNVVRHHDQRFAVVYRYSSINLLQEPLLLVASFFGLFVIDFDCTLTETDRLKSYEWWQLRCDSNELPNLDSLLQVLIDEVVVAKKIVVGEMIPSEYILAEPSKVLLDRKLADSFAGWLSGLMIKTFLQPNLASGDTIIGIYPGCLSNVSVEDILGAFGDDQMEKATFMKVFRQLIGAARIPDTTIAALFDAFDTDSSGSLSRSEFLAGAIVLCAGNDASYDKIVASFQILDTNNNGYLDRTELNLYCQAVFKIVSLANPQLMRNFSIRDLADASVEAAFAFSSDEESLTSKEFWQWLKATSVQRESRPSSVRLVNDLLHAMGNLL